jgi:AraC-like DNA-binding protein
MHFEFGVYSSLLLIFFVHGFVYSILLYRRSLENNAPSDRWLSLFLLLGSLYIAPWMLGFAGWYDNQPYRDILFYVPFQQLLFLGPVFFFYMQSVLNPGFTFGRREWLHLLPGFLYLLFCCIVFATDKLILHRYYFLSNQEDPDFDLWYQVAGFVSMLFYFLISLRYYRLYRLLIVQVISYAELVTFRWVKRFLVAFLVMLLLRLVFHLAALIPSFRNLDYVGPWWEYFSFAIVLYYVAIAGYSNNVVTKVPFHLNILGEKKIRLISAYQTTTEDVAFELIDGIASPDAATPSDAIFPDELKSSILDLMQTSRLYEDPELSLTHMASQLATNPSVLSKAINRGFSKNFNDFVNEYRIEAVKDKLRSGEQKSQTLLGIAYDCGFNSKATFNRAFKKSTGMNPKDWMLQNISAPID